MDSFAGTCSSSTRSTFFSGREEAKHRQQRSLGHFAQARAKVSDCEAWYAAVFAVETLVMTAESHYHVHHRSGCSNDIRQLWRDTLRAWPADRAEFEKKLVQAGLTTQAKVDANRRQMKRRLKEDKKKNRPRKQRDIKITNHHLIGTKLGEILAKGSQEQFTLGAVKFDKK